ncbi:MAG: succinate dehydrogenase iron-sulfur subunit [Candidatus Bathyarchaeia archaeon]
MDPGRADLLGGIVMTAEEKKTVEIRVRRQRPDGSGSYVSTYKIPVSRGMTVLDALVSIRETQDETLTFRYSCRMGICGSCGVIVNGKPLLGCYTQVLDLKSDSLFVEPLSNLPVIKDLVSDIEPFFDKYKPMKPYLVKPPEAFAQKEEFVQLPADLNKYWDLSLCIKCSLCYSACPASIDERFPGPTALSTGYRFMADSRDEGLSERVKSVAENIWLCTSCHSCTISCPKNVDSSTAIVNQRGAVVGEGAIPKTVQDILTNSYREYNPLGMPESNRANWLQGLPVKDLATAGKADILYFVCCLPSYDVRNQELARSMIATLNSMNADFAVLGNEEWCCGDHILRLGEGGLFEELAGHNVGLFQKYNINKIVTTSPHCYNTFKNDKPYTDSGITVEHYTQTLADALEKGKVKLSKKVEKTVAFHDPCFLGKRNKIFEPPRRILASIPGLKLIEMKRNLENSFCCGGGAGRVWTEEAPQEKRPCVNRVQEALEVGAEVIATACPFCITTLEDGTKVLDVESKIAVRDILELVNEAT